ncbi:MAG: DUF5688 family protein [Hungatella sp.]|jgi:hypothetical protein|nr:DUF5688 family protein [Hungatella sp.]
MSYKQFLEEVKAAVQDRLGVGYNVNLQKISKINGIVLDGLVISEMDKSISPTIYLNSYYMCFEQGEPLANILEEILSLYGESGGIAFNDMKKLLDFEWLKDKVVYKLIQKETNLELLKDVPAVDFLDLAVVFYLLLDESEDVKMTALIHNSHMLSWGSTKEELYRLAMENTPRLLPPVIRTMEEVMCEIMKEHLEELKAELLDGLFSSVPQRMPLYILSNQNQINGAGCILYDGCLETFAAKYESDIVILPSSTHEVLLIPDQGMDYAELQEMVIEINRTEVPEEEVLSDSIYIYKWKIKKVYLIE